MNDSHASSPLAGALPAGADGDDVCARAWAILATVPDPELPMVSVVELGMIRAVHADTTELCVELLPTFLGCPALSLIRDAIAAALAALGPVRVEIVRDYAWSTDRITDAGRRKLEAAGIAPPGRVADLALSAWPPVACPYCGSSTTRLESAFGPTPCRAILYCAGCRQPFEQIKPV